MVLHGCHSFLHGLYCVFKWFYDVFTMLPAHHSTPHVSRSLTYKPLFLFLLASRSTLASRFLLVFPSFPHFLSVSCFSYSFSSFSSFSQVHGDGPLWQYGGGARARPPRAARADGDATKGEIYRITEMSFQFSVCGVFTLHMNCTLIYEIRNTSFHRSAAT